MILSLVTSSTLVVQAVVLLVVRARWIAAQKECRWLRSRLGENAASVQARRRVAEELRARALDHAAGSYSATASTLLDDADRIERGGPA